MFLSPIDPTDKAGQDERALLNARSTPTLKKWWSNSDSAVGLTNMLPRPLLQLAHTGAAIIPDGGPIFSICQSDKRDHRLQDTAAPAGDRVCEKPFGFPHRLTSATCKRTLCPLGSKADMCRAQVDVR